MRWPAGGALMRAETPTPRTHIPGVGPNMQVPSSSRRVVAAYVHKLQRHEGHDPCFMTDARYVCIEFDCPWRNDCVRQIAD